MSEEIFPYDQWVNEALIKVLRRALEQLSKTSPMGDHHFFINIQTNHPDVDIPNFLRTQYPKEITIVLQHQFEELIVNDYGFEVVFEMQVEALANKNDAVIGISTSGNSENVVRAINKAN